MRLYLPATIAVRASAIASVILRRMRLSDISTLACARAVLIVSNNADSGSFSVNGAVNLNGAEIVGIAGIGNTTITGAISGAATPFAVIGPGSVFLTAANSYTAGTTVGSFITGNGGIGTYGLIIPGGVPVNTGSETLTGPANISTGFSVGAISLSGSGVAKITKAVN